ncbi:MAG TPA: DUF883 family protein [Candidatus Eisenbacteria bacterium]|jgi:ElaB/YqjD/DUF883 family membrane-anchored ribosome-binding protein|nr:DUF883 family protein [Candidatus Eisenbacteria bacterium]
MTESSSITPSAARDQLVADLKAVVSDAEELLRATKDAAGEKVSAARARAEATIGKARAKLANLDDEVVARAKDAAKGADDYVHEHPWNAVGLAAAAGLVIGILIAKR